MRTLLTFAGSVISILITVIILPLLAGVYTGLAVSRLMQTMHWHQPTITRLQSKLPPVHLPVKRQLNLLWQKALRLHW